MTLRMRVHYKEPIGAALRRFKKLIERSGMKGELRAHEYYEKPCEARRRKEARRKNAIRKAASMPRAWEISSPRPSKARVSESVSNRGSVT